MKKDALKAMNTVENYFKNKYDNDVPRFINNYIDELKREIKSNKI